jgi:HlyD family secretion protein
MFKEFFKSKYIVFILIVLLIISGCAGKNQKQDDQEKTAPVKTEYSKKEDLPEYQSFPGKVSAKDEIGISAKMGGKVDAILVKEGDKVKAGQTLIKLEQKDVISQINQAEAAYNSARAQLKNVRDGQLPQQIAQLKSGLNQAEANYKNANENYNRMKELLEQGAVSKQQFEGVELQYNMAKEQYELTKTQLTLTLEKSAPVSIEAAEAHVKQAEAGLSAAKAALENMIITSPIDGTVGLIKAQVGQLLSPGVPAITVGNTDASEIHIGVTEDRIGSLEVGQEAQVVVESAGISSYTGKITSISLFRDPMTHVYPVKILVSNEQGHLISGMFARVKLLVSLYPQVITVPEDALIDYDETKVVYCVENGTAKEYKVETGPSSMGRVVIKEGLPAGKQVVVSGQHMLQDGVKVKVQSGGDSQ